MNLAKRHKLSSGAIWLACAIGAALLFCISASQLNASPHSLDSDNSLRAVLPRFVQVALTGGDSYSAADINVIRALVASTFQSGSEEFASQAQAQTDAAWLNPYHEDNYYLAAAALSWNDQVDAANFVLEQASISRRFDAMPPFLLAFNYYHFKHDALKGAYWLNVAAAQSPDEQNRLAVQRMAARWLEKSNDLPDAIKLLETMASQAKYSGLRDNILMRASRIRGLNELRRAAESYRQRTGHIPNTLDILVSSGDLERIPDDPLRLGYAIDGDGVPQLIQPIRKIK